MSTLRVNAIVNAAGANTATLNGALPVLNTAPGLAKAWVNFNGTGTVAIRASSNVSSVTDNGVGDYTLNFTTAMASSNNTVSGAVSRSAAGTRGTILELSPTSPLATTSARVRTITVDTSPAPVDCEIITANIFA